MKRILGLVAMLAVLVLALALGTNAMANTFQAGDIVIYRVGDGTQPLTNNGMYVFLDEYSVTNSGSASSPSWSMSYVQTIPMPTTWYGANAPVVASGFANSEGLLTTSVDGRFVVLTGYGATLTSGATPTYQLTNTSVGSSSATGLIARVVGLVDGYGHIDTTTTQTNKNEEGNEVRCATSLDGTNIWLTGDSDQTTYAIRGSALSTQICSSTQLQPPHRAVNIFQNALYIDRQTAFAVATNYSAGVNTLGLGGLPTSYVNSNFVMLSGVEQGTPVAYPGHTVGNSAHAFMMFNMANNNNGGFFPDTIYVADNQQDYWGEPITHAGGVLKYCYMSGSWSNVGIIGAVGATGLTGYKTGNNITLFITQGGTQTSALNNLYAYYDTSGFGGVPEDDSGGSGALGILLTQYPTILTAHGVADVNAHIQTRGITMAPQGGEKPTQGGNWVTNAINKYFTVGPPYPVNCTGTVGGPFSSTNVYSIANFGMNNLTVTIPGGLPAWLTSSFSGSTTISPLGSITCTIVVNSGANSQTASQSGQFTFSSGVGGIGVNIGYFLTVNSVSVTPLSNCLASGAACGPFTFNPVNSNIYTLTNLTSLNLQWGASVSNHSPWLSLSSTGTTLSAHSSIAVTALVTAAANTNGIGTYQDIILFSNLNLSTQMAFEYARLQVGSGFFDDFSTYAPGNVVGQHEWTGGPANTDAPVQITTYGGTLQYVVPGGTPGTTSQQPRKNFTGTVITNSDAYGILGMLITVTNASRAQNYVFDIAAGLNGANYYSCNSGMLSNSPSSYVWTLQLNQPNSQSTHGSTSRSFNTQYQVYIIGDEVNSNAWIFVNPTTSDLPTLLASGSYDVYVNWNNINCSTCGGATTNLGSVVMGQYSANSTAEEPGYMVSKAAASTNYADVYNYLNGNPPTTPVSASFTVDNSSGTAPLRVIFTDTSTGTPSPDEWFWDFGDGHTSLSGTEQDPTNTYANPGSYTATLIASNNCHWSTNSMVITVTSAVPVARFTASLTNGVAPLTVTFTDTSTGSITNRFWNFGDGSTTNFAVATNPTHTYNIRGTNTVTLIVTGPGGVSTNVKPNYIVVNCPTITVSPSSLPNATVSSFYSQTISASGGSGSYTYTVNVGTLPAGLSLSSSGVLSGTPTAMGSFSFTVLATDTSTGCTGQRSYTLTVLCPTITLSPNGANPTVLTDGTVGTAYSQTFTASGADNSFTFTNTSGTLPTGLSLSSAGVLSGTPTVAGTYNFTVTAMDSSSCSTSQDYSVTMTCPTITVSPSTLPNLVAGATYSTNISATGSAATPYTFSVGTGLPTGLNLSFAGVLSGTPSAAGTYNFTVTATDTNNCTDSQAYTVVIQTTPSISVQPASTTICSNSTANFSVTASGSPTPGYFWAQHSNAGWGGTNTWSASGSGGTFLGTSTSNEAGGAICSSFGSYDIDSTNINGTTHQSFGIYGASELVTRQFPNALTAGQVFRIDMDNGVVDSGHSNGFSLATSSGIDLIQFYNQGNGAATGDYFYQDWSGGHDTGLVGGTNGVRVAIILGNGHSFTLTVSVCGGGTKQFVGQYAFGSIGELKLYNNNTTGGPTKDCFFNNIIAGGLYDFADNYSGSWVGSDKGDQAIANATSSSYTTPALAVNTQYEVIVTNAAGAVFSSPNIVTAVLNTNPVITTATPLTGATVGTAYSQTITASGGVTPYTFTTSSGTLPNGLSLFSAGTLSGTPTAVGTYNFTVQVTDSSSTACSGTSNLSVTVTCPIITVAPTTLPTIYIAVPYDQPVSASGGTSPYTFSITGGGLPTGLSMNNSGHITGTYNGNAGTANFTVTATDANGCTQVWTYTPAMQPCPTITLLPSTLSIAVACASYSQTNTASGGNGPYTYAETGTLPTGMTFSPGGVLSGTPPVTGTFPITITATDQVTGCTGSRPYTLKVVCPVITLLPSTLPAGTVGSPYSATITPSGCVAPYTFEVSSGSLPTGLNLDSSAGVLSGTPMAAGTFTFTVAVYDGNGCPSAMSYAVQVNCPAITLTPAAGVLTTGTVGTAYSQTFTASGDTNSFTYSKTGILPDGLSLNSSTGVLSGTPSAAGTYNFTVTATDSYGCATSQAYSVTLNCPTITLSPLPNGTVMTPYSQTITASGGTVPYTFSVLNGTLPSGLSLSAAGLLSGTPTTATNVTFTLLANDAYSCSGTQQYTVAIFGIFGITAITREGNDIRVTWTCLGSHSYVLQSTKSTAMVPEYTTNFADASPIIVASGLGPTTTNYLDVGAAYAPVVTSPGGTMVTTSVVPSTVYISAVGTRGITDSLGHALPIGSLVMLGTFDISEPTIQLNFAAGNVSAIMSNFTPYSTSFKVGDGTSQPASWEVSLSAAGFGGQQIYLLAVDKPTFGAANHLGIYTAPSWVFPDDGNEIDIDLADVSDFVIGAQGGSLTISQGLSNYTFEDTSRLSFLPGRILFYRVRLAQ